MHYQNHRPHQSSNSVSEDCFLLLLFSYVWNQDITSWNTHEQVTFALSFFLVLSLSLFSFFIFYWIDQIYLNSISLWKKSKRQAQTLRLTTMKTKTCCCCFLSFFPVCCVRLKWAKTTSDKQERATATTPCRMTKTSLNIQVTPTVTFMPRQEMGQLSSLNKFRAYNYNVHD